MNNKSLGIIQIDLPEIIVSDDFGGLSATDISSILSDEQKSLIIQAMKGEKLVYINIKKITDTSDDFINETNLIPCSINVGMGIRFPVLSSSDDKNVLINLVIDSGTFYVYC